MAQTRGIIPLAISRHSNTSSKLHLKTCWAHELLLLLTWPPEVQIYCAPTALRFSKYRFLQERLLFYAFILWARTQQSESFWFKLTCTFMLKHHFFLKIHPSKRASLSFSKMDSKVLEISPESREKAKKPMQMTPQALLFLHQQVTYLQVATFGSQTTHNHWNTS